MIYGSVWMIGDVNHLGKFLGMIFVNADKNNTYPNTSAPVTFKGIGRNDFELLHNLVTDSFMEFLSPSASTFYQICFVASLLIILVSFLPI